jgi:hypothetical protein
LALRSCEANYCFEINLTNFGGPIIGGGNSQNSIDHAEQGRVNESPKISATSFGSDQKWAAVGGRWGGRINEIAKFWTPESRRMPGAVN